MMVLTFVIGLLAGLALAGYLLADRLERARELIAILEQKILEQEGHR